MQRALLGAILLAPALAGCIDPEEILRASHARPTGWEIDVDPAMAPDFTGKGETYPVLLIHEHHVWSESQIEQRRNVVCATTDGRPLPLLPAAGRSDAAMAPCMGAPADPATGRVHLSPDEYRARAPAALAILMDSCSGGVAILDAREPGFLVRAPEHDFRVEALPDGTFRVDGHRILPGTALKIGYFLHEGSTRDEEYHRYVFEAPGRWLVDRIAPATGPIVPPHPERGSGLTLDVPLAPHALAPIVDATLAATPGSVQGIAGLRAVHDGTRLTDLAIRIRTRDADVTWYSASRTDDTLHLFAALAPIRGDPALEPAALAPAFHLDWSTLAHHAESTVDVRLEPTHRWTTLGPATLALPPTTPLPCDDGCVNIHRGGNWERAIATAQESAPHGAATLHATTHENASEATRWWQVE